MTTGLNGTYVLSSDQTFLDGLPCKLNAVPRVGQVWSWQGDATRLDGTDTPLLLTNSSNIDAINERAARSVAKRFDIGKSSNFLEFVDVF